MVAGLGLVSSTRSDRRKVIQSVYQISLNILYSKLKARVLPLSRRIIMEIFYFKEL